MLQLLLDSVQQCVYLMLLVFAHYHCSVRFTARALKFYEGVFGWKFEKWKGPMDYWLIMTGENEPGIDGGLARRENGAETVNTIGVPSIAEYIEKIKEHKRTIVFPKRAIPGMGWMAFSKILKEMPLD